MKNFFLSSLLLLSVNAFSQSVSDDINKDVWFNFMQAYQDLDASLFNQIHTNDVLRIPVDGNMMMIGQEYKDANLENFNRWNQTKVRQKIEFSFYSRIQKANWAYETGIYKLTRFTDNGSQSYYGKFHVTLKKVSGTWKIFIDSDSSNGGTIGEEDFLKGDILR
ncbi:hypothetical protein [Roseivirga sp.]|uniref:hypothetical protein n=1 Tax=Roseivirga sp. TaxID=1964215 RepID=UPI003B522E46